MTKYKIFMREIIFLITLVFLILPNAKGQDGNAHDPSKNQSSEQGRTPIIVEKRPEYPGGNEKFYKYINKNLKYPKTAKRNGVSGKTFVEFAVNTNGTIDDESVRILTADELTKLGWSQDGTLMNKECEFEAMRLLKECPDWKPAMQKGQPVKVIVIIPITFRL